MPAQTKTPQTRNDAELVSRLRLATMRLARRLRQQAEPGVSPSLLSALASIERRQPVTLGELSQAERVQPPTMTKIAARLEDMGLVARTPDERDKRIVRLALTSEGVRFIARNRSRKNAYLARRLRKLEADDIATLQAAVEVIEKLLEEPS
jgi:DNA-binding MarR family transcriptional regulator